MIIIYTRKDLVKVSENKPLYRIEFYDIKGSVVPVELSEITIFIDDDGDHKVLKNRYDRKDPRTKELLKHVNIGLHSD